ncbi:hypothetical protein Ga0074812_124134 [Parafrankia irregularis]|uniref:Uncharacterized protein n=1 Tax=Parafrankia irregularis TaxID=795642 RepID=A0A0S4QU25_9ACTN|nr:MULTISPECIES: hypothetical protein [Parafrankia]MBE3203651.1 hypothetical protein [Parafrankia sp. CH37]CUU59109.1 hypothetical protein Ga0074812_124134 [Parafrankia irregularis]
MPRRGVETVAATYRSYVLGLLDQDMAFDDHAAGDPPLLLADYRRAVVVVLALDPSPLLLVEGTVTSTEAAAFTTGQRAGLDAAAIAIGEAWRPALLRHGSPRLLQPHAAGSPGGRGRNPAAGRRPV